MSCQKSVSVLLKQCVDSCYWQAVSSQYYSVLSHEFIMVLHMPDMQSLTCFGEIMLQIHSIQKTTVYEQEQNLGCAKLM